MAPGRIAFSRGGGASTPAPSFSPPYRHNYASAGRHPTARNRTGRVYDSPQHLRGGDCPYVTGLFVDSRGGNSADGEDAMRPWAMGREEKERQVNGVGEGR